MFLDGDLGRMFKDMPKVLLLVMSVSLIEAFLILPHHLFSSFSKNSPGPENSNSIHTKIDRKFEFFKNNYLAPLIKKAIQYRYIFVGFLIFIFFISAAMIAGRRLKFSALPEIDGDVIEARLIMPAGTPVNITKKHVNKIVSALKQADKDNNYVLNITEKYGINQDANESGGHLATVTADLLTAEKRKGRLDDLTNRWRDSTGILPGIESISFKEPFVGPAGKPIHIQLYSRHFHVLEHISRKLVKALSEYEGITDIISDMRSGKPEIRIKLKESAEALGISAMEISSQLRSAFYGSEGGIIYNNEEPREIAVELSRYDQTSLTVLDDFRIQDKNNNKIPLYELVEVVYARNLSQISRTNRKRCLNIYAEIDKTKGNVIEIMGEIEKSIVKPVQALEPTLTYEFKGEIETMNDVRPTMGRAVMLGIIGIFIILSFQFKSYKEPVLIMGAVPLALVGVVWGHILMGYDLAMPSMVGFISLAGIVVNNSIILVQFIGINMAAKKISLSQAALEAALQRFRPILITSLTTVAGMTPLLLEKSLQAQILIPLTISVIFGMSVSTLLILFFIPAIYTILDDFK
jgi:multidrug efflux pump subunit AcrB